MNILYLDSKNLSFNFVEILGSHKLDIIDPFKSLTEVSRYFNANSDFDLILYNPYLFMNLI